MTLEDLPLQKYDVFVIDPPFKHAVSPCYPLYLPTLNNIRINCYNHTSTIENIRKKHGKRRRNPVSSLGRY